MGWDWFVVLCCFVSCCFVLCFMFGLCHGMIKISWNDRGKGRRGDEKEGEEKE